MMNMAVKQKKTIYWFLLAAVFMLAAAVLSVSGSKSYYANQVIWNTLLHADATITSDCLRPGGQIILLGDVTEESAVEVRFQSAYSVYATLHCELAEPDQETYLTAFTADEELVLTEEGSSTYLMLIPSKEAAGLEEDVKVDILLTLEADGEVLEGIFRAILPGTPPVIEVIDQKDYYSAGGVTEGTVAGGTTVPSGDSDNMTHYYSTGGVIDGAVTDSPTAPGSDSDNMAHYYSSGGVTDGTVTDGPTAPDSDSDNMAHYYSSGGVTDGTITDGPTAPDDDSDSQDYYSNGGVTDGTVSDSPTAPDDDSDSQDYYSAGNVTDGTVTGGTTVSGGDSDDKNYYSTGGVTDGTVTGGTTVPGGDSDDKNYYSTGGVTDGMVTGGTTMPGSDSDNMTHYYAAGTVTDGIAEVIQLEVIGDLSLDTVGSFALKGTLPVGMNLPEGCKELMVSLTDGPLPPFTRYSVDGGETWYLLYYGGEIHADAAEITDDQCLLLDLHSAEWDAAELLQLSFAAYTEEGIYTGEVASDPQAVLFSTKTARTPLLMNSDGPLVLAVPESWSECEKEVLLEQRVPYIGGVGYEEVPDSTIETVFGSNSVTISAGETLPPAGTYRMTILYRYNGICFAESEITFFVNYANAA